MRGQMHLSEPMSAHTSWRVGGRADRLYRPADLEDLSEFLRGLPEDEPVMMLGLGSNLLVRDGGIRGTVILMHRALNELQVEGELIHAEAGVACAKVARFAAQNDFQGAEFLAGIPGTVGGALAMNAGCYGGETWRIVSEVGVIDRAGRIRRRKPGEFRIGYREVEGETDEWFVAAWFRLEPGDGAKSSMKIKQLLESRIASQPIGEPNAGSVFRNPQGDHAARLIESCGLKGMRIGDAMVSEKHANFIVNLGAARASEIERLIEAVQRVVFEKTGIELYREVRIVGEEEAK